MHSHVSCRVKKQEEFFYTIKRATSLLNSSVA